MSGAVYYPHLNRPEAYLIVVSYGLSGDLVVQRLLNGADGVLMRGENGDTLGALSDSWHEAASVAPAAEGFMWLNRLGWALADSFVETVLTPDPTQPPLVLGFREIRWPENPVAFRQRLDFIAGFFPGARFVFHTRNPADVAQIGWWAEQDADQVIAQLEARDSLFAAYLRDHPDRGIRLHFDDYRQDPEALRPLYDLAGAPFDPERVAQDLAAALEGVE